MKKLVLLIGILFTSFAESAVYVEGDILAEVTLKDQFEQAISLTTDAKVLLFSRDMDGGKVVQAALDKLADNPSPKLPIYFANINGMPSLIAKFVAIPKMQNYRFSIGLDREGEVTARLPSAEDQATLIRLNRLKIIEISHFEKADTLLRALEQEH